MTLKSGIFSLLAKCVFLCTSPGYVQVYHSCLKKYFNNSTKSLEKYFMKNNHHLDFLQGLFSASGINTAFFYSKKWQNWLKIDFLGCHGNEHVEKKERRPFFFFI